MMRFEPPVLPEGFRAEDWQRRRGELLSALADCEYGITPPVFGEGSAEVDKVYKKFASGHGTAEEWTVTVPTPGGSFRFPAVFAYPCDGKPHPTILLINFRPAILGGTACDMYFPGEEILDHGFAVASFCYTDVTADNDDLSDGFAAMFPRSGNGRDWGKIGMWAYCASRLADCLLRREEVDGGRLAVLGHSRLGKTALWCGAQDERFRFVLSNCSGCGGAAYGREKHPGGETAADITRKFGYWFCDNFRSFAECPQKLPADQHWLLAACAPRFVAIGTAGRDAWSDLYGQQLSCIAAGEVWRKLGGVGYRGKTEPATVGDFFDGDICYFLRDGIHFLGRSDWLNYLKFISAH